MWGIVDGTETDLCGEGDQHKKFISSQDRALVIIVLSVDPSLLYLLGDAKDPVVVWKQLSNQFQKKTWTNKSELRLLFATPDWTVRADTHQRDDQTIRGTRSGR